MPTRDAAPNGAPCWVELFTSEPDKTIPFYEQLFGWTHEDAGEEYGHYINFSKNGVRVAGGMANDGSQGVPDVWTIYLSTDDIQKTADAATANGGQVHLAPMDVMALGKMAMVADPSGAAIGLWQPGEHAGFGLIAEPGAPSWFELHTRDYEASVAFFQNVLSWDTHVQGDTPEFRYTTLGEGDDALAGIMDATGHLPEGVPSHWGVYFGSEDTKATVARVKELGGDVVQGPDDTPYGVLAVCTDPTGAQFRIVQPPAS
jgi:predicted enzyme related to lactoylglutathione lyase